MRRLGLLGLIILVIPVLVCPHRNRILTQPEAEQMAGIFCLPTYLPPIVDTTPVLYAGGDPDIPKATTLYSNMKTSERLFVITMDDITHTSAVRRGDPQYYDPYLLCENRFILPNGLRVCDSSSFPFVTDFEENTLVKGPPLDNSLRWLVQKDEKWTTYRIDSSLSFEETEKIAASMECVK